MKEKKQRLDELLVERELVQDMAEARGLVMAGKVVVDDQRVDKPGAMVGADQSVRVKGQSRRFVSRAGDKLLGALMDFGLAEAIRGKRAIDIGASTGGFTDCLLQAGVQHVVAVDVGTNQLDYSLRQDPRVTVKEKCDVRSLDIASLGPCDVVVADISFNSLTRLADAFWALPFEKEQIFVLLVKPQFELPSSCIDAGGLVSDPALQQKAVDQVRAAFTDLGAKGFLEARSKLTGRTGNQEIFLKFARSL